MNKVYLSPRKKKAKHLVFAFAYKGLFISLAIIIQLAFYFAFWIYLDQQYYFLSYIATALGAIAVLILTNKEIHPSIKQGWMFLILLFPLSGSILYFSLGKSRGAYLLRKRISQYFVAFDEYKVRRKEISQYLEEINPSYSTLVNYLDKMSFPIYHQTKVSYFDDGRKFFEAVLQDIARAEKRIFLEFFIVDFGELLDKFIEVLEKKAAEGVEVFFIYDGFGGGINLPRHMPMVLEEKGIKTKVYNPMFPIFTSIQNNRDHRKIVVIDEEVAYTGGANLADEYINYVERFGYWKDSGIRLEGEGALGFSYIFLEMWNAISKEKVYPSKEKKTYQMISSQGFVIPYTDSPMDNEALSKNVIESMLSLAKKKIYISTPYLIPPFELKELLFKSSKADVDVRIFIPGIPDKPLVYLVSMAYARLFVEAGIKVYLYQPGFLHAKNMVIDDRLASVGTVNIDFRSLYHHFECGVLLLECEEIKDIQQDFIEMMAVSKELTLEDFKKVNLFGKTIEVITKLFLPLL